MRLRTRPSPTSAANGLLSSLYCSMNKALVSAGLLGFFFGSFTVRAREGIVARLGRPGNLFSSPAAARSDGGVAKSSPIVEEGVVSHCFALVSVNTSSRAVETAVREASMRRARVEQESWGQTSLLEIHPAMTIPTEPIGSIPRPNALIAAATAGEFSDAQLEPLARKARALFRRHSR